jgi:hypothetical protein
MNLWLGPSLVSRIVYTPLLAVDYIGLRVSNPSQLTLYQQVMQVVHATIEEMFSERVIIPGRFDFISLFVDCVFLLCL